MITWAIAWLIGSKGAEMSGIFLLVAMGCDVAIFFAIAGAVHR